MTASRLGVVEEVVFTDGKQDSKATIAVWPLLSYLQVDPSAFRMIYGFLLPKVGLAGGEDVSEEGGVEISKFCTFLSVRVPRLLCVATQSW